MNLWKITNKFVIYDIVFITNECADFVDAKIYGSVFFCLLNIRAVNLGFLPTVCIILF
jgi:hypothetical protein